MVTSCDPINPYTQTGTFGVSYNGGYKPDLSLQWIPPDTNVISGEEEEDTFAPPPLVPPPNMLMQTCEGRRYDIRKGGIPKREMDFDDFTVSQDIAQVPTPPAMDAVFAEILPEVPPKSVKEVNDDWNMLMILTILLIVVLVTLRSS